MSLHDEIDRLWNGITPGLERLLDLFAYFFKIPRQHCRSWQSSCIGCLFCQSFEQIKNSILHAAADIITVGDEFLARFADRLLDGIGELLLDDLPQFIDRLLADLSHHIYPPLDAFSLIIEKRSTNHRPSVLVCPIAYLFNDVTYIHCQLGCPLANVFWEALAPDGCHRLLKAIGDVDGKVYLSTAKERSAATNCCTQCRPVSSA